MLLPRSFKFLLRCLGAAALLVFIIWLARIADSPGYRYSHFKKHRSSIYAEEGKVDFVAIGSSRAVNGFDASLFDKIMSKKLGQKVVVYDLSRLFKGRGIDYVTIRDLLEERTVGHIIIEYKYERREYKYGNEIGSPYFKHCARIIDLADSHFKSQPFLPYYERLQKFTKDVLDRMSLSLTCLIKGKIDFEKNSRKKSAKTCDCVNDMAFIRTWHYVFADRAKLINSWLEQEPLNWSFFEKKEIRNTFFTKKIIQLAKEKNVKITFVYYPSTCDPLLDQKLIDNFEKELGHTLHQPPKELFLKILKDGHKNQGLMSGFAHPNHMSIHGRKLFTSWIATLI